MCGYTDGGTEEGDGIANPDPCSRYNEPLPSDKCPTDATPRRPIDEVPTHLSHHLELFEHDRDCDRCRSFDQLIPQDAARSTRKPRALFRSRQIQPTSLDIPGVVDQGRLRPCRVNRVGVLHKADTTDENSGIKTWT